MSGFFNMDSPIMRFLSRVCDLMILNFMCLICCIPIVTIGASFTALYTVTMKMVRGEESYIFKGFLKAFKENLKSATPIWLIMLVLGLLIFADYRATGFLPGTMGTVFKVLIGVVVTFYVLLLTYIFPYVARFENNIRNSIKNALLISILNLPQTILLVCIPVGLIFITMFNSTTLVYGSLFWFLLGVSFIAFTQSYVFRKVFAKYEPQEEEEEKSPDDYVVPEDILPGNAQETLTDNTEETSPQLTDNHTES